ncbi:hypothetical protein VR44_24430 [Streptomyces katrae]|uniref:Uncharacterized protein n=1 Tax=Streptomyces katrae TaxID=68223 RepID=A0A0F4J4U1_9ACTN|nr:hypothetical protein VR44_24430 [Streptomyces katrae]
MRGRRLPGASQQWSCGSAAGLAKRLHARALADGQPEVAGKLTYVFGSAYCAECGALFRVDHAIVARWGG